MKPYASLKIYIPSTLPMTLFPSKHSDKYYYFIHKIYEERVFNKQYEYNSYINLNTAIMRYIIGRWSFEYVRDDLFASGIVESDNRYIVGKKSKGYRLTLAYSNVKHKQIEITDPNILYRISQFKQRQKKNIPVAIEYQKLIKWLYTLSIDYEAATQFINSHYGNDIHRWNCNRISVDKIKQQDIFYSVDHAGGRFHSNLTNLSKDLRKFLKLDDKVPVNVDCANSQPFLFNILINNVFNNNYTYKKIFFNDMIKTNKDLLPYDGYYDGQSYQDIVLYKELTSSGKFYEYLMDKMNFHGERYEFKKRFFGRVFYSENNPHYVFNESKIFNNLFPNVSKIIDYYKRDDNSALPIALQKAEREIIINKIVKRIVTERPNLPIGTIHDSILTSQNNENYVRDVMYQEFYKEYKLTPTIN